MVNSIRCHILLIVCDIFFAYTGRVIGDFVLHFVAMATGVGRGRICLASFNSLNCRALTLALAIAFLYTNNGVHLINASANDLVTS